MKRNGHGAPDIEMARRDPSSSTNDRFVDFAFKCLTPWWYVTDPIAFGLENVPAEGPILLVGNHTLMGVLDTPILYALLRKHRGFFPRTLGDHIHFRVPGWRDALTRFGAVEGTMDNARALLDDGAVVLVFPGGGREVAKRRHERYQLVWKQRTGFARLALQTGAKILPFAAIGAEDMLDVVVDADDYLASRLGPILRRLPRRDMWFPVVKGLGPTPVPRPARLYFKFASAIDPRDFSEDEPAKAAWRLREATRAVVVDAMRDLREIQASDPRRHGRPSFMARRLAHERIR